MCKICAKRGNDVLVFDKQNIYIRPKRSVFLKLLESNPELDEDTVSYRYLKSVVKSFPESVNVVISGIHYE